MIQHKTINYASIGKRIKDSNPKRDLIRLTKGSYLKEA